uniref:L-Fucosyltransferase n=1 Tax=Caenorhabditis tropicalis TaxID=1561998 RepID=A0A1I7TEZ2_9PELO
MNNQFEQRFQWVRGFRTKLEVLSENPPTTDFSVPTKGFLSSKLATGARLANHIFELASIFGISRQLHRKPAIFIEDSKYNSLLNTVRRVIPGLLDQFQIFDKPVPREANRVLLSKRCCVFDDPRKYENVTDEYLHLTGNFYQSWKYFDRFSSEIRNFVKPSSDFSPLPQSNDKNFISCIHIRRTDFVDGQHHSSDVNFIKPALDFIKENEKKKGNENKRMLTVIMGDDQKFEEKMYENTVIAKKGAEIKDNVEYFVSDNSPHDDLAYSRYHCDAVLITGRGGGKNCGGGNNGYGSGVIIGSARKN